MSVLPAKRVLTCDHHCCLSSSIGQCESVCEVIHTMTTRLQMRRPAAFILVFRYFNHVSLSTFTEFVDCPTRENKTLTLPNSKPKEAYSCTAISPLGRSDHNFVHLLLTYRPLVKWQSACQDSVGAVKRGPCRTVWRLRTGRRWVNHMARTLIASQIVSEYINLCWPY